MAYARLPISDEHKVAWGIPEWAHALGVSRSYVTSLISKDKIKSVKLGYKRLITTSPADFIKDLPRNAPHERRGRGRPRKEAPLP
jgi:excisionase family DNA binding protein